MTKRERWIGKRIVWRHRPRMEEGLAMGIKGDMPEPGETKVRKFQCQVVIVDGVRSEV